MNVTGVDGLSLASRSTAATASYYTGSDTAYFSDRRFLVLGLVLNYQLFETTELYLTDSGQRRGQYDGRHNLVRVDFEDRRPRSD